MRIYADLSSEALWLPEWQRALQPEDLRLSLRDPVGNGAREYPRGFRRSAEIRVGSVQRNCIHIPNRRPHSLVRRHLKVSFTWSSTVQGSMIRVQITMLPHAPRLNCTGTVDAST